MNTSELFRLVLTEPLSFGPRQASSHTVIELDALTALELTNSRRARLADSSELPRLAQAARWAAGRQATSGWLLPEPANA